MIKQNRAKPMTIGRPDWEGGNMKQRLLLQTTILAAGLMAGHAFAQNAPPARTADPTNSSPQAIGEVVVTGVFSAKKNRK